MDRAELLGRVEQLHRASQALHGLVGRATEKTARVVTLGPKITLTARPARRLPDTDADADWPMHGLPPSPLLPPTGLGALTLALTQCEVVACDVRGLRGDDLDQAVAGIVQEQRRGAALRPVFLADGPDFSAMSRRGFAVEYVPHGQDQAQDQGLDCGPDQGPVHGPDGAWRDFLKRKWAIGRWLDLREVRAPTRHAAPARPAEGVRPAEVARPVAAPATTQRRKAAVIAWDLGHNPVGRAMVIYDLLARDWDVELLGPIWSRFGGKIWGPIAGSDRKVRGFACSSMVDYWPAALALASAADYDLVVVCKPRLPSLLLGALIKDRCGCPMVLDVDDFELSFFPDETTAPLDALSAAGAAALHEPYAELATRAADGVVKDADAVIVSNMALRDRFGGIMVRHARDEDDFHPDRFDRAAERAAMGMADDDFAIVFVGTARAHKGVFDIARTLAALEDKRFVLHLVGTITDKRIRAELDRHKGARIVYHPDCGFDELPAKIVAADAVVLLQDRAHPISQYQIPAKVSDAGAFGLPILVTDVPPLRDLAMQGLVQVIDAAGLGPRLQALRAERDAGLAGRKRRAVREAFEQELGFRVNRERLELAIARAAKAGPGLPSSFRRLLEIAARAHADLASQSFGTKPATPAAPLRDDGFDLVMFWKQNDSGIYGRRSDMMMKHLIASGRVRRVLQIDAPMEVADLARLTDPSRGSAGALVLGNTVANQFGLRDSDSLRMRTYLWDRKGRRAVLPHVGTSLADYPAWVKAQMDEAGINPARAFAWVCPVVFDFPAVAAHIPFRGIIGDLIDDQRNFEMSDAYRPKITASYAATLPLFDLTFTNCAPVAQAFKALAPHVTVVPNGTERVANNLAMPDILAKLPRPLAGYVGNLRDRIDWALLHDTALAMPDVHFAIVGGGAREGDTDALGQLANVTFTGVVPYDQVHACIRAFDVALVPHLRNALTASMNPLKVYNYFAAGRPIVSTEVDNVDTGLLDYIRFAADAPGFADEIRAALAAPRPDAKAYAAVLDSITWDARAAAVLQAIDRWMKG